MLSKSFEGRFRDDEQVFSRTDLQGNITLANKAFFDLTGFSRDELMGEKHNVLRHPLMPSIIYRVVWNKLNQDETVIAFFRNRSKNNKEYWIVSELAPYVTEGIKVGYTAQGGKPCAEAVKEIKHLYDLLLQAEKKESIIKSAEVLKRYLENKGMSYNEYMGYLLSKQDKWYTKLLATIS